MPSHYKRIQKNETAELQRSHEGSLTVLEGSLTVLERYLTALEESLIVLEESLTALDPSNTVKLPPSTTSSLTVFDPRKPSNQMRVYGLHV